VSEDVTAAVLLLHERSVNESIIVWDLEIVPDLAAAARLFDMGGASDAEVHEIANSG
jgi:Fe2+ transport system protein FeoA